MELIGTITNFLKVLCKVVEHVGITMDYIPHRIESRDIPGTSEE